MFLQPSYSNPEIGGTRDRNANAKDGGLVPKSLLFGMIRRRRHSSQASLATSRTTIIGRFPLPDAIKRASRQSLAAIGGNVRVGLEARAYGAGGLRNDRNPEPAPRRRWRKRPARAQLGTHSLVERAAGIRVHPHQISCRKRRRAAHSSGPGAAAGPCAQLRRMRAETQVCSLLQNALRPRSKREEIRR